MSLSLEAVKRKNKKRVHLHNSLFCDETQDDIDKRSEHE